ncbi:MAG: MFS transporter [Thermodesulfobacteriota bacterium]
MKRRIFYGWVVVAGLFGVALLGPMGRYILTSLFPFILTDPGWSRDTVGLAFTLHFWVYAGFAFATGKLLDRIGGRWIIATGGVLMLTGLIGLAQVRRIWEFHLIFGIVLAAAVSMTHFVPNTAIVRKWFIRQAGLATGIVTAGTVLGLALLPPIVSRMSAAYGWRTACQICGWAIGGAILAIALGLVRSTPESMGLLPDGDAPVKEAGGKATESPARPSPQSEPPEDSPAELTPAQAYRTRRFWYFFLVYAITGIPLQGILSHIIVWAVEAGVSVSHSGWVMAALTLPSLPIRVLAGRLGDRFGKRRVLLLTNGLTAVMWFIGYILIQGNVSFFVFVTLLGFVYSAPFSLYTPYLGDLFGRASVGTLMGAITLGHGVIGGVGPYLWGWIADRTGSYGINCIVSGICYALVTWLLWKIRENPLEAS